MNRFSSVSIRAMRSMKLRVSALVVLAVLPSLLSAAPVDVVGAEFGIFDVSNPKETLFVPTRVVPHKAGTRYGWVIEINTRQRSLSVREEYLLPSPLKATQGGEDGRVAVIPFERRNQVSQRQLVPVDGRIIGDWEIGPGEPRGPRHLQVVVEGSVVADFEYEVR